MAEAEGEIVTTTRMRFTVRATLDFETDLDAELAEIHAAEIVHQALAREAADPWRADPDVRIRLVAIFENVDARSLRAG